jgi:hypothetical protein
MSSKKNPELSEAQLAEIKKKKAAKDKIKRDKKKKEKDEKEELAGPPLRKVAIELPVSNRRAEQLIQKETSIRSFFDTFEPSDPESEIIKKIKDFSKKNKYIEKETFQDILKKLPENLYHDFINKYKSQENTFKIFWNSYKSKTFVFNAIVEKLEKESDDDDEEEEVVDTERLIKPKEYPPGESKVSYLDEDEEISQRVKSKTFRPKISVNKELVEVYKKSDGKLWKQLQIEAVKKFLDSGSIIIENDTFFYIDDDTLLQKQDKPNEMPKDKPTPVFKLQLEIKPYEQCADFVQKAPWLKKNVKQVFVTDSDKTSDIKTIMKDYKITPENYEGTNWYPINKLFINIMCRNKRYWNDDDSTVTIQRSKGPNLRVKFAYAVKDSDKIIIQNKKLFTEEKKFMDELNLDRDGQIKRLMASPINEKIEKFALTKLIQVLTVEIIVDEERKVISPNNDYIVKIIYALKNNSPNIGFFIDKIAHLIVFLKNKESVFFERVKEEYYIPEILWDLSIEEKLPEVFDDPQNDTTVMDKTLQILNSQIKSESWHLKQNFYKMLNPDDKIDELPRKDTHLYHAKKWKSGCKNQDDEDIKNSHATVLYYTENGHVYCLNIWDIHNQIQKGEKPINKKTGEPLSEEFLKKFKKLYDPNKFIIKEDKEDLPKIQDSTSSIPKILPVPVRKLNIKDFYAPELLEMIIQTITDCEQEFDKDNNVKKCKSFNYDEEKHSDESSDDEKEKHSDESSDDEKEKHSDESSDDEKEKHSDESRDDAKEKQSDESRDEKKKDLEDDDHFEDANEFSPSSRKPKPIKKGNICQYCDKKITKKYIKDNLVNKTTIQSENGDHAIVYFCELPKNCFEKYNFVNVDCKKSGGRCSSTDRKKNEIM